MHSDINYENLEVYKKAFYGQNIIGRSLSKCDKILVILKGALTSLMELQRVPKNIVTSLEGPWGHRSNTKELRVPQINSRWEMIPWIRLKRNANFPQEPQ